jgi:hypothetical protein
MQKSRISMLEKQSATTENVLVTMDSQPIVISHSLISGTLTNQSSSINMNQQPSSVAVSGRSSQISSSGRIEPKLKLKNDHGLNTQ